MGTDSEFSGLDHWLEFLELSSYLEFACDSRFKKHSEDTLGAIAALIFIRVALVMWVGMSTNKHLCAGFISSTYTGDTDH